MLEYNLEFRSISINPTFRGQTKQNRGWNVRIHKIYTQWISSQKESYNLNMLIDTF